MPALRVSGGYWHCAVPSLLLTLTMVTTTTFDFIESFAITYPGTKWCGPGNISADYEELGLFQGTDNCCRAHDECPDLIPAGESRHGLDNNAPFTKLSCQCDYDFDQCLVEAGTPISYKIRFIYFDKPGSQCYRLDYPIIRCAEYYSFLKSRCKEYELNTTAPKIYQWFDLPLA